MAHRVVRYATTSISTPSHYFNNGVTYPTAAADILVVAGRTPAGRLNLVRLRRRRPLVRATPGNQHLDSFATDAGEKNGLARLLHHPPTAKDETVVFVTWDYALGNQVLVLTLMTASCQSASSRFRALFSIDGSNS